jgi:hypothetical protein
VSFYPFLTLNYVILGCIIVNMVLLEGIEWFLFLCHFGAVKTKNRQGSGKVGRNES